MNPSLDFVVGDHVVINPHLPDTYFGKVGVVANITRDEVGVRWDDQTPIRYFKPATLSTQVVCHSVTHRLMRSKFGVGDKVYIVMPSGFILNTSITEVLLPPTYSPSSYVPAYNYTGNTGRMVWESSVFRTYEAASLASERKHVSAKPAEDTGTPPYLADQQWTGTPPAEVPTTTCGH